MNKTMLLMIVTLSLPFAAQAVTLNEKDLTVTKVTVETPLPSGLESVAGGVDKANKLYAAIKTDSRIEPFIEAAEEKYLRKNAKAAEFGNHATVTVNCNKHPAPYGTEDKNMCQLTVVKTYGWYADLSLILTVEGFLAKSVAKDYK